MKFYVELIGHYRKPLEREATEGCNIYSDDSDIVMNIKLDHHLPVVSRAVFSATAEQGRWARGRRGVNL